MPELLLTVLLRTTGMFVHELPLACIPTLHALAHAGNHFRRAARGRMATFVGAAHSLCDGPARDSRYAARRAVLVRC
eukprot:6179280-Pleurochrysis_carterae.AAC.2